MIAQKTVIIPAVIFNSFLLQKIDIKNQTKIPVAIPVDIDDARVIIIMVKNAGVAWTKSFQLTFAICCIIIIPINTSAGEITSIGIELINGDRNKNGKNINPAKIAVRPELAPWAIPTPDSTTTVDGLDPSIPATVALVASARKVFFSSLSL